ncbi:LOW QUALITY PROTEIN: hypothetical protein CFOL_v3_24848 [Cephalotus follicularis]|uniref:HAT C-terminal dimerisation domain-containing protein n=1 Tax=Cephalotus follicularis TaxID=3775 RepID=A0A1Q3CMS1_CEPFO|nr:LOW QUALITY PROTEIN: hypothetical protein CFOL_v3_24848 [Cephalotus follicularis]
MILETKERSKIDVQMDQFTKAKRSFGIETAILRYKKSPDGWWSMDIRHMEEIFIRALSLSRSSCGCERNWSVFEMINGLHQQNMNELVFVMYNLKLKERSKKRCQTRKQFFR